MHTGSSTISNEAVLKQITDTLPFIPDGVGKIILGYSGPHLPEIQKKYYGHDYDEKADFELLAKAYSLNNPSEAKESKRTRVEQLAVAAVEKGAICTLQYLLMKCGVDPVGKYPVASPKNNEGIIYSWYSLIEIAVQNKQESILVFLLENFPECRTYINQLFFHIDASDNNITKSILMCALEFHFSLDTIILLIQMGVKIDCADYRDYHVFPAFIKHGVEQVPPRPETELCKDVQKLYDYLGNKHYLLSCKFEGHVALTIAIGAKKPLLLRLLLQLGAPIGFLNLNLANRKHDGSDDFHLCNQLFLQAHALSSTPWPAYKEMDLAASKEYGKKDVTYKLIQCHRALFANRDILWHKSPTLWQLYSKSWRLTPGDFRKKALALLHERGETITGSDVTNAAYGEVEKALARLRFDDFHNIQDALWDIVKGMVALKDIGEINPEGDFFTRLFFIGAEYLRLICTPVQKREYKDQFHSYSSFFARTPTPDRTEALKTTLAECFPMTAPLLHIITGYEASFSFEEKAPGYSYDEKVDNELLERDKHAVGNKKIELTIQLMQLASQAAKMGAIKTLNALLTEGAKIFTDAGVKHNLTVTYDRYMCQEDDGPPMSLPAIAAENGQEATLRFLLEQFPEARSLISKTYRYEYPDKIRNLFHCALAKSFDPETLLLLFYFSHSLFDFELFQHMLPEKPATNFYRGLLLCLQAHFCHPEFKAENREWLKDVVSHVLPFCKNDQNLIKLFDCLTKLFSTSNKEMTLWQNYSEKWHESKKDLCQKVIAFIETEEKNADVAKNPLYQKVLTDLYNNKEYFKCNYNLLGYFINLFPEHYKTLVNDESGNTLTFFAKLFFVGCKVAGSYFQFNPKPLPSNNPVVHAAAPRL